MATRELILVLEVEGMREFDYETTQQAREHLSTMADTSTREGQRQFEELMRIARIRERDEE